MPKTADLHRCLDPTLTQPRERYESFRDGGGGTVSKPDVIHQNMTLAAAATAPQTGILLTAEADGASLRQPAMR